MSNDDRRAVQHAMALMVVAMLTLPGIDAIAKWLGGSVSPGLIAWCRFFFQTLFMLPLVLRVRVRRPRAGMGVHALRGVLMAAATLLFFTAVQHMPLANAIAIFFVEPLLVTMLAAVFLGEPVGWRRISAVVVGLVGAVVVIRPGFGGFGLVSLLPLAAAVSFAVYLLLTRRTAPHEDPAWMQLLVGVFGGLVMTVALGVGAVLDVELLRPRLPTATQWALLAGLGVIATAGHLLVVHAFRRAPATLLAPFQYLEIVSATLLGWVLFDDFPDAVTWVGVAIIVGSGLYVFHRERVRGAAR
ncbi:MAG: DMT family transporter [Ectothiorhodospiraceae bacterium]|nr:DMT family transporter [Chromatiales bacterium]MCP5154200.1 DMT family transporter [Ectothiorhodospiraceae bacterium]